MGRTRPALLAIIVIATAWHAGAADRRNSVLDGTAVKEDLVCPSASVSLPPLSLPCKTNRDCGLLSQMCCDVNGKKRCRKAVPRPTPAPTHKPFIGIPRECPVPPVMELLPVKNCTKDSDCWPRICCPEGAQSYCRTSLPYTEGSKNFTRLRSMVSYFQCTPPPLLDLFPKPCRSPIDCIPNLCCQEQGRKVCRPAKKSVIALALDLIEIIPNFIKSIMKRRTKEV